MENHFLGKSRVGLLISNIESGKVLITRNQSENIFEIPGGRMDIHETIEDSIVREIKEELNLDLENILLEYIYSIQEIHGRENSLQLSLFFKISLTNSQIKDLETSDEAAEIVWVDKSDFEKFTYFNSTLLALKKFFETK